METNDDCRNMYCELHNGASTDRRMAQYTQKHMINNRALFPQQDERERMIAINRAETNMNKCMSLPGLWGEHDQEKFQCTTQEANGVNRLAALMKRREHENPSDKRKKVVFGSKDYDIMEQEST